MAQKVHIKQGDDIHFVLDHALPGSEIYIAAGEYRQKTVIRTPGITLIGEGADRTVIVYNDYAKKLDEYGMELGTFRSYTTAVCADNVTMRGLSVKNDSMSPETKGQEVALTVYGDNFVMEDCTLSSTQDTLFLGPLPPDLIRRYEDFLSDELRGDRLLTQRFTRCLIEGTVDFIFGCGNAVFEDCEIKSLNDARRIGYIAAPAHSLAQTDGFLFQHCRITCDEGVDSGSIYLARPWRDYGLCVFDSCTYAPHIASCGFDKWGGTDRDRTARFIEKPAVDGRVTWANRMEPEIIR